MRLILAALCGFSSLQAALLPAEKPVVNEVSIVGAPLGLELETKVGRPLDPAAVRRDVRALWATQRYSDIEVVFNDERDGVYFRLEPLRRYRLRSLLFEPRGEARELDLGKDAEVDRAAAREMAREMRLDLVSKGFRDARVDAELLPVDEHYADVRLRVDSGEKIRVAQIDVDDPYGKQIKALAPTRLLPGWRLSKAYTSRRLNEDIGRLRSSLLASGHFDAQIRSAIEPLTKNRVGVSIEIDAGPRYRLEQASLTQIDGERLELDTLDGLNRFCPALLDERAAAERAGRLDFAADIEIRPLPPTDGEPHRAVAAASVRASDSIRVRWINLEGAPSFHDKTLRKAMSLDEGDLLNLDLVRRSLARLSRFSSLKPVSQANVELTRVAPGQADLTIHLEQQGARRWTISGPLGPMSLFGAIHGGIETRLPPWGRGLLQLSTYTVGGWLTNTVRAVVEADGWAWKTVWLPSLVLSRPAMPGHAWTSGYLWSPQLTAKQALLANGALRLRSGIGSLVEGAPPAPPLRVSVRRADLGPIGEIYCKEGRPWTDYLRTTARLALAVAGL